jgi:uncharacterized protein with NRDE domain
MCLIAWNWQPDSATPLLLLANRDEFYGRAALPLHWWEGGQVLAGRDLQAGGSWLGLDRRGRLAALTNYRLPGGEAAPRPSRGALVANFLQGELDAAGYLAALLERVDDYNPFNLLLFDGRQLLGLESRHRRILSLPAGLGAVSNADFNTPWPKLERLKSALHRQCQAGRTETADLLPLLQDTTRAVDAELPQTGVPLELERTLSATFVASEHYGTRVSSIVHLGVGGAAFFEQAYAAQGGPGATQQFFTPSHPAGA